MVKFTLGYLVCIILGFGSYANPTGRVDGVGPFEYFSPPRIVGGQNASNGQFPYQISLRNNENHICGGSIITHNYVVTAAHCVQSPQSLSIRAGSVLVNSDGEVVGVSEVKIHPNYQQFDNDIALLKLSTPLTFTDHIKPIPLDSTDVPNGAKVIVSGWGGTYTGSPIPTNLQYTTLKAISNEECTQLNGPTPQSVLCLAPISGNGACNGDSGGPAVYNDRLVGVVNYGVNGCGSRFADGFSKVSWHYEWLRQNTDL